MIAPPSHRSPDAAQVQVLFAEARRRRWRRRLAAGVASLVLAGLAVAVSIGAWSHQRCRGRPPPRTRLRPHSACRASRCRPRRLPGGLRRAAAHRRRGNAGPACGRDRPGVGRGGLARPQAGGRIYAADSPVIREFDPGDGQHPAAGARTGVFPSADGKNAYVERTSTSLAELRASGRGVLRRMDTPAGWYLVPIVAGEVTAGVGAAASSSARTPAGLTAARLTWPPGTRRRGR